MSGWTLSYRGATDAGSGSILIVAVVAVMFCIVALVAPVGSILATRQRVSGAADAAALAAADAAIGISAGVPCAAAADAASANGARLTACSIDGVVATVRAEAPAGRFEIASTATAGPPPG